MKKLITVLLVSLFSVHAFAQNNEKQKTENTNKEQKKEVVQPNPNRDTQNNPSKTNSITKRNTIIYRNAKEKNEPVKRTARKVK